jgi:hypothetical protein
MGVSGTTFADTSATSNITYYYKVSAVVSGSETDQSSEVSATSLTYGTTLYSNACGILASGTVTVPTGWSYDSGYSGGTYAFATYKPPYNTSVTNAAPAIIYNYGRGNNSTYTFTYTYGGLLPNSNYDTRLHFVAQTSGSAGQYVMNVSVNGVQMLTNFDPYVAAGNHSATAVVEDLPCVSDGKGNIAITVSKAPSSAYGEYLCGYQVITGTP